MSLTSAISTALSGLRATQAGMDVVAQNVSNSGTAGYTRRSVVLTEQLSGDQATGVKVEGVQRLLDTIVQSQVRLETSGAAYTDVKAQGHASLDGILDAPGATNGLPTLVGAVSSSLSALTTNPASYSARAGVLSSASALAGSLNALSGKVQSLRQDSESAIGVAVTSANDLLKQIAATSGRIASDPANAENAGLLDQRDGLIDQLSEFLDVKVTTGQSGNLTLATTGGLQLFDGVSARQLSFDARSAIGPDSAYSADPAKRGVGTVTATDGAGRTVDVLATGGIRSGKIAASVELRDQVLPKAQTQLDALAASLATALSNSPIAGTAATSGAAQGFDLDLSALQAGNPITVTTTAGGAQKTLTFVKATSAAGAAAATKSGDGVVGVDFSGGYGSVATQIGAALGSGFTVSNPSGATLRVLDDGATGQTNVKSLSAGATVTGLATGAANLPLFKDGASLYTGSYEGGSQLTGFAGRITVNPDVQADPSTLVIYQAGTQAGDTTRPAALLASLQTAKAAVTGRAGIGGSSSVFTGTVSDLATQILTTQANDTNAATALNSGQKIALNSVQARFSAESGVNIDTEMSQLIQLQSAYGANARVMTAAKEMLDTLLRVGL